MMDDKKTFAPGAGEDYEAILREKQRRVSMLYDGVMGQLPEWMPGRVRLEFTATRTRILKTHTHADLLEAISNVIDAHGERFGDEDYLKFEFNSKGFSFDIAVLARMKKAVELGPMDGLALLTDQAHADNVFKGDRYGDHQSGIAQNDRPRIKINGKDGEKFSVSDIIKRLAKQVDSLGDPLQSDDLWPLLFAALADLHTCPVEITGGDMRIKYNKRFDEKNDNPITDEIKYSSFKAMLTKARKS